MGKYLFLLCVSFFLAADKTPVREGQDYALFIAIDQYEEWPDLNNPVSDARAIAKELAVNYNFSTEVVVNPSREEIYAKLAEYRKRSYAAKEDQLFIFLSGHGAFNEDSKEGFFVPREGGLDDPFQTTYIPHARLEQMIDNIPCDHILLTIDACYSGTFDKNVAQGDKGAVGQRPSGIDLDFRSAFIQQALQKKSRLVLTSGGKERTPDGDRFSPLTERLLEALGKFGLGDGILTFTELAGFMQPVEPKPHFASFGSQDPGGEFLFVNRLVNGAPPVGTTTGGSVPASTEVKEVARPQRGKLGLHSSLHKARYSDLPKKMYSTLELNGLVWLNENLVEQAVSRRYPSVTNARKMLSGDEALLMMSNESIIEFATGLLAYNYEKSNRDTYGYLYGLSEARSACERLGKGWRLPTVTEWESLLQTYAEAGGYSSYTEAGLLLQKNDREGLNIKLGGMVEGHREPVFQYLGQYGMYLASDVTREGIGSYILFDKEGGVNVQTASIRNQSGFSCRCVKDL